MPLMIGGGNSRPYIRFSPASNAWLMSSESGTHEFNFSKPVAIDVQNIQLGWLMLETGQRDWQPWKNNVRTPSPGTDYKEGLAVLLYSKDMFGDTPVRELVSNQTGVTMSFKKLYDELEEHPEFAAGKTPILKMTGAPVIKIGKGTSRIPAWELVKWVDRPAAFDEAGGSVGNEDRRGTTPGDKPKAEKQPAPAETDEF